MYCTKCGADNPEGASFCRICGNKLTNVKNVRPSAPYFEDDEDDRTVRMTNRDVRKMQMEIRRTATVITVFDGDQQPYQINLETFGKNIITFGRSPENDIVFESPVVSRRIHGRFLLMEDGRVLIEDAESTNGLTCNGVLIARSELKGGDIFRIDNGSGKKSEGVLILPEVDSGRTNWVHHDPGRRCLIGRSPDADLQLSHVGISKEHAEIFVGKDGFYYIRDLNSTNGVILNGQKLRNISRLREKDTIVILDTKIIFSSGILFVCTFREGLEIEARNIVKQVGRGKITICNGVSLSIKPGELVAIIGGSGAGKTTFMNAISGYSKPTSGKVLVSGEDLYETYDSLKSIIGYVPQQDIVYDNLTLQSMLMYAAKLRLPDDTTKEERADRVAAVIKMVELEGKEDTMIRRLSGGQKKRASIAVELLSDPKLFFLDEPASGLDPGTERNLMNTLKNMTQDGKTVILVTHSTLNLQNCDKIVFMGKGGNLCYFGNMKDAERFFGVETLVDVYNMITDDPLKWRRHYEATEAEDLDFENRYGNRSIEKADTSRRSMARQTRVLSGRYFRLLLNDRQRLLLVLLQAPLLGFLISLVANGEQFEAYGMTKSLLFALSCSAFWVGTLNAIQEICKERVIFRREYMTGLRVVPYIISKFVVLGVLCLVESTLLSAVFVCFVGYPDKGVMINPILELAITTFLTSFAASGMGLLASSMFKNPDRAMTVAPILLMPQILFSGLLFDLEGITKIISWFAVCRWSMEGYGTTADLNSLTNTVEINGNIVDIEREAESFFEYTSGHMIKAWLILIVFVLAFAVISTLILRNIRKSE